MSKNCNNDDVGSDCQWWVDGLCEHVETCGEPRKIEPLKPGEHTPGPWTAVDNRTIRTVDETHKKGGLIIADVFGHSADNTKANARLIATSPELLEICEYLAERNCEYPGSAGCDMLPQGVVRRVCLPCKARALIATTTG